MKADFQDYIKCASNAGDIIAMNFDDFYDFENGLSQGYASKSTRPLLASVYVVQFKRGSTSMFYKTHQGGISSDFMEITFLKKKSIEHILKKR